MYTPMPNIFAICYLLFAICYLLFAVHYLLLLSGICISKRGILFGCFVFSHIFHLSRCSRMFHLSRLSLISCLSRWDAYWVLLYLLDAICYLMFALCCLLFAVCSLPSGAESKQNYIKNPSQAWITRPNSNKKPPRRIWIWTLWIMNHSIATGP